MPDPEPTVSADIHDTDASPVAAGSEPTTAAGAPTRRSALLGLGGAVGVLATGVLGDAAHAAAATRSPLLLSRPDGLGTPPAEGLHLTFGADTAREMIVSWVTRAAVRRPRVVVGTAQDGPGRTVAAYTRVYRDGLSGQAVYAHHATLDRLRPDTEYTYTALHDGGRPDAGVFRTAPSGRAPFVFTSFGDQGVPGTSYQQAATAPGGYTVVPSGLAGPAASDVVDGVEQVGPLFNLVNGDLSYANLSSDRVRTWYQYFTNASRSARYRPWMPAAGNHDHEKGNGPIGFTGYQTWFQLPGSGAEPELAGLWYAFTVGSVRVVVVQNDDFAIQDGGDAYIRGYSGGRQARWLEAELRQSRADRSIDWLVVVMHQVMISSTDASGCDLGVREQLGPLLDRYGVDLVLCGHEHDYERSLAIRGTVSGSDLLTPRPVSDELYDIDTEQGTSHMVLGGGGNSDTTNQNFFPKGESKVIIGLDGINQYGQQQSVFAKEDAVWQGVRNIQDPYGFAAFEIDPGRYPGDTTRMYVTYYVIDRPSGQLKPWERFTLRRRRRDG